MDVSQYLEIFIDESNEHLQSLSDQLMILEKEPENSDTINEIFRAAHSLKGMAGTMGYKRMQNLTHDMENVFSEVRNGNMKVTSDLVDVLFQCLDALEEYVNNIQETQDEGTNDNEPIIKALNAFIASENKDAAPAEEKQEQQAESAPAEKLQADEHGISMELADFEKNAVNEALKKGMHVYEIKVTVDENCILKAARAFLVFKNLEGHGDIIKSDPSVQDIEDEKFDFDFQIVILTEESFDDIIKIIKNVSEIKDADGEEITKAFPEEKTEEEPKEEKTEEKAKQASKAEPSNDKKDAKGSKKPAGAKQQTANSKAKPVGHTVRVDIEKLDVLMNLVSELIIAKNGLVSASSEEGSESINQSFNEQIEYLERVTTNLHESVMKVRMMPIESVVSKFPRMIRDLSKKLDKKMELYMSGEDTELDRTVIDEIGDPLMHLLRNSADHGLESAEVRKERGKSEVGSIFLDAYQDGNNVVIEVRDDGNGIDIEKVKSKAIEKGNITEEQAAIMSDKEIIDLLFRPSFSTSDKVTDVSGRGVGLDVVKSKIEALGGDVKAEAYKDIYTLMGTYFKEHMPDKLVTFHPFGRCSSTTWFADADWLDFNMFQSGHRGYDQCSLGAWDDTGADNTSYYGEDNWKYVLHDRQLSDKPVLDGEPSYEWIIQGLHDNTEPYWRAKDVRRYAYWSVLAGACGHTYGDNAVMQFHKNGDDGVNYGVVCEWEEALHHEGSGEMLHLKKLMESVDFTSGKMADELLLSGQKEKYGHISVFAGSDYVIAYDYSCSEFTLDVSAYSGKSMYWMSPVTGVYSYIGKCVGDTFTARKPERYEEDNADRVLVIS